MNYIYTYSDSSQILLFHASTLYIPNPNSKLSSCIAELTNFVICMCTKVTIINT